MQTPTLPVAWAYPVAACPAPCSWRTRTCRTAESNSGSYAGRIAPPGVPKTTSTPTASRERTRLWAPVMPVADCGRAAERAVVSTPRVAAAAASDGGTGVAGAGPARGAATAWGRAAAGEPGAAAGRPVLLVVLIWRFSLGAG